MKTFFWGYCGCIRFLIEENVCVKENSRFPLQELAVHITPSLTVKFSCGLYLWIVLTILWFIWFFCGKYVLVLSCLKPMT